MQAAAARIAVPPELQREVDFWIRVYTEITTSDGFLHDQNDLGIVYRTLRFKAAMCSRTSGAMPSTMSARKIEKMLRRLAAWCHVT